MKPELKAIREREQAERIEALAGELESPEHTDVYPISDDELLEIRQMVDDFVEEMRLKHRARISRRQS